MGAGKPYTTREIKQIVDLWRDGVSVKDISSQIGRGGNSVRGIVYRQRLQQGATAVPRAVDRGWSDEQRDSLTDLWAAGCTVHEIARTISKKPCSCMLWSMAFRLSGSFVKHLRNKKGKRTRTLSL